MSYKTMIHQNTLAIAQLYSRIQETLKFRSDGPHQREEWVNACAEFHAKYDQLAFIGGVETARDRLRAGEAEAIDYALDFLEVRPYFIRSGYLYKDLMRVLRNCPLSQAQRRRYDDMVQQYSDYRDRRRQHSKAETTP